MQLDGTEARSRKAPFDTGTTLSSATVARKFSTAITTGPALSETSRGRTPRLPLCSRNAAPRQWWERPTAPASFAQAISMSGGRSERGFHAVCSSA